MHPQGGSPFFRLKLLTHGGQSSPFGQGATGFGRAMHDEPGQGIVNERKKISRFF